MDWLPVAPKKNSGQSLIEVLAALVIILLAAAGFLVGVTSSLKNSQFSKNQSIATKYAQEGLEKARDLRNKNTEFWSLSGSQTPEILPPNNMFTRVMTYTRNDKTMDVMVTVSWKDAAGTHQSKLTTKLTKW